MLFLNITQSVAVIFFKTVIGTCHNHALLAGICIRIIKFPTCTHRAAAFKRSGISVWTNTLTALWSTRKIRIRPCYSFADRCAARSHGQIRRTIFGGALSAGRCRIRCSEFNLAPIPTGITVCKRCTIVLIESWSTTRYCVTACLLVQSTAITASTADCRCIITGTGIRTTQASKALVVVRFSEHAHHTDTAWRNKTALLTVFITVPSRAVSVCTFLICRFLCALVAVRHKFRAVIIRQNRRIFVCFITNGLAAHIRTSLRCALVAGFRAWLTVRFTCIQLPIHRGNLLRRTVACFCGIAVRTRGFLTLTANLAVIFICAVCNRCITLTARC